MKDPKHKRKRFFISLTIGLLLMLATIAGLWLFLQTNTGRQTLAGLLSRGLSRAPGVSVELRDISGRVPHNLTVAVVTVGDDRGTWLNIEQLKLRWRPWQLLLGRIRITSLSTETIDIRRLPGMNSSTKPGLPLPSFTIEHVDLGRIMLGNALMHASGSFGAETVNLGMTLSSSSPDFPPFTGLARSAGRVEVQARLRGPPSTPTFDFELDLAGFKSGNPDHEALPAVDLRLKATIDDGRLHITAVTGSQSSGKVHAECEFPIEFSLAPFRCSPNTAGKLDGVLKADADLAVLNALPQLHDHRFAGGLRADMTLGGTLRQPRLTGDGAIRNGSYESFLLGTVLHAIEIKIQGDARRLTLNSGSATDGGSGRFTLLGHIDLQPENDFPFRLELNCTRAELLRRDDITATVSGATELTGTSRGATLGGRLQIMAARLDLNTLRPKPPPTLDALEPVAVSRRAGSTSGPRRFQLDIGLHIEIPAVLAVTGRSLDSVWQGDIELQGGQDRSGLVGHIQPQRGYINFLGRRFRLNNSGRVRFVGAWPPMPLLDLSAHYARAEIEATLRLEGSMSAPVLTLESNPPLPRDEILTRVLFGKDSSTITPFQAVELAAAAARLTRQPSSGLDLVGSLRERIRIDRIDMEEKGEGETSDTQLVLGKQVSHRLYVEMSTAFKADRSGSLQAEYEINRNLSLETDIGGTMRSGVGVNWKMDY